MNLFNFNQEEKEKSVIEKNIDRLERKHIKIKASSSKLVGNLKGKEDLIRQQCNELNEQWERFRKNSELWAELLENLALGVQLTEYLDSSWSEKLLTKANSITAGLEYIEVYNRKSAYSQENLDANLATE
eukprot:maker-scaffold_43-snap-gene-1.38-mRNA-1 protein AED:0.00 eAED:0.00 QI:131/1/1/1/0/0.33/3/1230/129